MKDQEQQILNLIKEKDMTAYEVIKSLRSDLVSAYKFKVGEVVPQLHSLEKRKYIKSYYWKIDEKIRKYYTAKSKRRTTL